MDCLITECNKKKALLDLFKQETLIDMSEKDLVKNIKNGSKNWKDWNTNDSNRKYYEEIERRNQLIKYPEGGYPKIFRDDPEAIKKMNAKIEYLEKVQQYWKSIIKFPARDYSYHLGDAKWYNSASTDLNMARKKLALIENQGTLTRKPVFIEGKKHFKYVEGDKK